MTIPYIGYLLLEPLWYITAGFADLAWGAPGFIERLFTSPLILVLLAVLPLYDRKSAGARRARNATWFGLLLVCGFVLTTVWGYLDL